MTCLVWQVSPSWSSNFRGNLTAVETRPRTWQPPGLSNQSGNGAEQVTESNPIANNIASQPTSENNLLIVLYWTKAFSRIDFNLGLGVTPFNKCAYHCVATANKSQLDQAAAVLFHGRTLVHTAPPQRRSPEQLYVFSLRESPQQTFLNFAQLDGFFNISMTYSREANIYYPYAVLAPGQQEGQVPYFHLRSVTF